MRPELESDATPLDQLPRVRIPRPWRRHAETVAVIASLFIGGFATGFIVASRAADGDRAQLRADHYGELERLQSAYGNRLNSLSGRVDAAADTAASAAVVAGEAATAAQSAAQTANQAAKTVNKEVRRP